MVGIDIWNIADLYWNADDHETSFFSNLKAKTSIKSIFDIIFVFRPTDYIRMNVLDILDAALRAWALAKGA